MCGIVGYTGRRAAADVILEGLRRLEYRGYDSAGVATVQQSKLAVQKRTGRISCLMERLAEQPALGYTGIGHTRWATHGRVTEANAHPHVGGNDVVAVVHNGVIENHAALRAGLEARGFVFHSQTDTEVIAHLIAEHYDGDLLRAVAKSLSLISGTYGLAVISPLEPGIVVGARLGSPLVMGIGHGEHFLASDPAALVGYTEKVVYLDDHQLCVLTPERWSVRDVTCCPIDARSEQIALGPGDAERGAFEHFTLKEIYEQPEALENTLRGRLDDLGNTAKIGGLNLAPDYLRNVERIVMIACGSSYHAALAGEYLIEAMARIPVDVEVASEFRYRSAPLTHSTLAVVLSQSGETADTLFTLRELKRHGIPTVGICNVVGSSIAREVDGGIYLHAGPEIGVASTKAFLSQLVALTLFALHLGRLRRFSPADGAQLIHGLRAMPDLVKRTLDVHESVRRTAERYADAAAFLYLGRHLFYPIALEGALKLKEISYIYAEAYPAGEMKHGPLALVASDTPSVFLIPKFSLYDKVMSNMEEVRAREGPIIAVATEGDRRIAAVADDVLFIPPVMECLQPVLAVIPLQLLAYELAILRGRDIDKPRNLAKSVTVE